MLPPHLAQKFSRLSPDVLVTRYNPARLNGSDSQTEPKEREREEERDDLRFSSKSCRSARVRASRLRSPLEDLGVVPFSRSDGLRGQRVGKTNSSEASAFVRSCFGAAADES